MPDDRLPKKLFLVKSRVAGPQAALGLVSTMLQCVIVSCVASLNLIRVLRADCLEGQDLPCTYLAHHELKKISIAVITRHKNVHRVCMYYSTHGTVSFLSTPQRLIVTSKAAADSAAF